MSKAGLVLALAIGLAPALARAEGLSQASAVAPPDPFEQVIAARHVADFGRRRNSVQAMITAARMLQEVKFQDNAAPPAPDAGGRPAEFTPEGLYAEAEAMAQGDPQVLTQIRVARSSGRGVLTSAFGKGLVRTVRQVGARAVYAFNVQARAGELLRIGAIGDTTISMVMRLRDTSGRLLCNDGGDYAPVCSITPLLAAALRVEIENKGGAPTQAVILSN